jgi:multiple sugar transport system permease protein
MIAAWQTRERRLAAWFVLPAIAVIFLIALVPIALTLWESLHVHDLRLPWLGRPFIGFDNFIEAIGDSRFRSALTRTLAFAAVTVPIEIAAGVVLALVMHSATRGRAVIRAASLLPWAIPTVVAALLWRFMFDSQAGVLNVPLRALGLVTESFDWFVGPFTAWVPIALADIWKSTPFVAVLVLAGLQTIDSTLYEAAAVDGATRLRQFFTITLPLLRPVLVVAAAFRALDALRLFDLAYVLTGGGPGAATEPLSLYAFIVLMQRLRFGYGSALSITVFLLTFGFALLWVRALGRTLEGER